MLAIHLCHAILNILHPNLRLRAHLSTPEIRVTNNDDFENKTKTYEKNGHDVKNTNIGAAHPGEPTVIGALLPKAWRNAR